MILIAMSDQPVNETVIVSILYKRLQRGELSAGESELLHDWMFATPYNREVAEGLLDGDVVPGAIKTMFSVDREKLWQQLAIVRQSVAPVDSVHRIHFLKTAWFRYAAVLMLIAGTATFLYRTNQKPQQEIVQPPTNQSTDIQTGGNRAMLTLSDGRTIVLDSPANGALAQQGNSRILKMEAGKLAYQVNNVAGEIGYNTITTPKGGQYQIVLPDGTKVWLNAASSIHFPTVFEKDRKVTITGEVYFEIASDKNNPFFVTVNGSEVQVLGTSFNINAYVDEPAAKISLLSGSVKVNDVVLKPGQAYIKGSIVTTNLEQDIAWKNGFFNLENADLKTVMRQFERWYNIQVRYESAIPAIRFRGEMNRGVNISDIINFLKESDIQVKLEGRTLIVK